MSPRLILFDLDETLFDHRHSSRTALEHLKTLHSSLAPVPIERLEAEAARVLECLHERVLSGELSVDSARIERLDSIFSAFGVSLAPDALDAAAREYGSVYRGSRRAIPGAIELLDAVGIQCGVGIVTNHLRAEQESKLEDCGLSERIDFMVTSEEAGCRKPSREIFESALSAGGASAADAVMIGDRWDSDIVGAVDAGIRAVWLNRDRKPQPAGFGVDELKALAPLDAALGVILRTG